jgi:dihydrofolate synthase/folylpolyglutamate synthase
MADETRLDAVTASLSGTSFRLTTPLGTYDLSTPLLGAHQAENASAAIRAAELLRPAIGVEAIVRGVGAVRWPGRLERLEVRGKTVLPTGATTDGAAALASFVRTTSAAADLVFGAMADKDIEAMAAALGPAVRRIRLVSAPSPRAATPEELARRFAVARPDAVAAPDLAAALAELLADPATETILIAGSLYLVGEARTRLLDGQFEEGR